MPGANITVNMWYHTGTKMFPSPKTALSTSILQTALVYLGADNIGHMSMNIDCFDPEQIKKIEKDFQNFKNGFEPVFSYERIQIENPLYNNENNPHRISELTQYKTGRLIAGLRLTISFWPSRTIIGNDGEERDLKPSDFLTSISPEFNRHPQDMIYEAPDLDSEEMHKRALDQLQSEGKIVELTQKIKKENPGLALFPKKLAEYIKLAIRDEVEKRVLDDMTIEHKHISRIHTQIIAETRAQNEEIFNQLTALNDELQTLHNQIKKLEKEIDDKAAIKVSFRSSRMALESSIAALKKINGGKIDEIKTKIAAIEEKISQLTATQRENNTKIYNHFVLKNESKTEGIHPDISFSLGGTNAPGMESEYDTFIKELKILQAFQEQINLKNGYQVLTHNCSTMVKECLIAGIDDMDKKLIQMLFDRDNKRKQKTLLGRLRGKKDKDFFEVSKTEIPSKVYKWALKLQAYMQEIIEKDYRTIYQNLLEQEKASKAQLANTEVAVTADEDNNMAFAQAKEQEAEADEINEPDANCSDAASEADVIDEENDNRATTQTKEEDEEDRVGETLKIPGDHNIYNKTLR